jgi:hypothetical protein
MLPLTPHPQRCIVWQSLLGEGREGQRGHMSDLKRNAAVAAVMLIAKLNNKKS